jgi:hypothetical protein
MVKSNGNGHMHARASREHDWEPMACSSGNACQKRAPYRWQSSPVDELVVVHGGVVVGVRCTVGWWLVVALALAVVLLLTLV